MSQVFIRKKVRRALIQILRLLSMVGITFFGLLLVTFLIGRVVPIDPVLAVVGDKASHEVYERARIEMGLHLPLWQQFFIYMKSVLRGDLGVSVLTAKPVLDDIFRVFPATMELAFLATFIGVLVGIPLGVLSAVKRGGLLDHIARVVGLLGYSLPIFWLALLALMFFYARFDLLPGPGRLDVFYEDIIDPVTGFMLIDCLLAKDWEIFKNAFYHLIMPATLLGYYSMAYISRMTRSFMIEQLRQEYILTARVKGVAEWKVVWSHALGNCAIPLITVVALSFGTLLEGSVLTETVFSWPGLGLYLTSSLLNADMNSVLGSTIVVGAIFLGVNLFSDLLYKIMDPRAR
ncbi:ABC transporter permease [uncultured Desulfuromusa sp.]|uniref:ABC transporter permease n=1 Tax=uncultured Desulfuromusa sp. TaxID=219183 RepID=UPI002AA70A14|nr:ABC transporter permease [uncultured Desulfuromusa sp.]